MDTLFSTSSITSLWLKVLLSITISVVMGLFVQWGLFKLLKINTKKERNVLREQVFLHLSTPSKFLLPLLFVYASLLPFELSTLWMKLMEALIIINFAWLLIAFLQSVEIVVKQKFQTEGNHKAKDRKVLTQLRFLKSLTLIIILTLAVASILWNIPEVRKLGTTILTSAGVIGIIAGVAAQKSLANLITGMQIAFTQPIKIDDEVFIEGEFGTVEDITLTYVVIKTWDWRRLVLPLNYFNDHHFINWTFNSTQIIGTVFLYVDYTFPVSALRKKFLDSITKNRLWDQKTAQLLVTNTDAFSVEVRATFSARNPSDAWDLRCQIREELIAFMQEHFPESLPKLRREPVLNKTNKTK